MIFDFYELQAIDRGTSGIASSFVLNETLAPGLDTYEFSGIGSIGMDTAALSGDALHFNFDEDLNAGQDFEVDSFVFGVFSTSNVYESISTDFNAINSGGTEGIVVPYVYTAVKGSTQQFDGVVTTHEVVATPEPSTFLLLIVPLAIILVFRLKGGGFKCVK
jgi:hypothetical protein